MYPLLKVLFAFFSPIERCPAGDEAYLAESVDLNDLELRMRALDERGRNPRSGITLGLYAC